MESPAGWYPDPDGSGGQRYFDGAAWTGHRAPPPGHWPPAPPAWGPTGSLPWGVPPWKGAELGRPATGSGSLADPGRRLGARLLDYLVMTPVLALIAGVAIAVVAPHAGPIFPTTPADSSNSPGPTPGIVWIWLTIIAAVFVTGLISVAYETVATARFGRTLGKRWLHIRPLRTDGRPLGWGRAFGRVAIYWLFGLLSWIGLIDPLFCLWDGNRQCLHDKVVSTVVVND